MHPKVGADLGAGGEDVVQAEVGVSDRGAVLCGSRLVFRGVWDGGVMEDILRTCDGVVWVEGGF